MLRAVLHHLETGNVINYLQQAVVWHVEQSYAVLCQQFLTDLLFYSFVTQRKEPTLL